MSLARPAGPAAESSDDVLKPGGFASRHIGPDPADCEHMLAVIGARSMDVAWMVMREALAIAALGALLGAPLAWWLSRYVESQLFGVTPTDAATFGLVVLLLAVVAVAAGLVPSHRASRVEPMTALRYE